MQFEKAQSKMHCQSEILACEPNKALHVKRLAHADKCHCLPIPSAVPLHMASQ